jgi:hypothetical protein
MPAAKVSSNAGMFVVHKDGRLIEMVEQPYDSEKLLQALLSQYPSLLAGNQIDPEAPRRWLLVSREYGVPDGVNGSDRWALDHLFLDQEGIPTLVEVKRSSDTRIRREVVGQMLDYASNAVLHWPIESIRATFEARCESEGKDSDELVEDLVGQRLSVDEFWDMARTNLRQGKIRLLFVADVIPQELRRIIEFLNGQMTPAEVLAVEIRQFVGEGLQTLVPRVMGQTMEGEQKKIKSSPSRIWDVDSFMAELRTQCGEEIARLAGSIYDWSLEEFGHVRFSGTTRARFGPTFGKDASDVRVFVIRVDGQLVFRFPDWRSQSWIKDRAFLNGFRERLNKIPGLNISEEDLDHKPIRPLNLLLSSTNFDLFKQAVTWLKDVVHLVGKRSE